MEYIFENNSIRICLSFFLSSVSEYRYSCVPVQYYADKETVYQSDLAYWMVSKCKPTYPSNENKTRCESPGHVIAVDSIIPVSDQVTKEVYRNRYCYHCNRDETHTQLFPWIATIENEQVIDSKDETFWDKLKREGGNVIFKAPEFLPVNACNRFLPNYNISSCNVTGLWQEYNQSIEMACESYIDPFNHTFKNYFCYLCNTAKQSPVEQWKCLKSNLTGGDINLTPPFAAILDITVFDIDNIKEMKACETDQFPDNKMVSISFKLVQI